MSSHSLLEYRGVEFEAAGDRDGIELIRQRVTNPAEAVAWAIEGASDAELSACASAIVKEQVARDEAAQAIRDQQAAETHLSKPV